ncbi:MAG: ABC-F family ATP-binding cassette domain-containing protein, partial [Selenomonadaceae bacterium]|nr:ABC-F family ATP-binding cassette domain-containing protein [Selenomonadaceae bacterium]
GGAMIQLDNVTKFYGERLIFRDVTFKVADGEKFGIVGKNGAGKSTLIKIMTGAEPFDAGTIGGLRAEDIGFVEQTPKFSAATLLDEMLTVQGVEKFQARKILYGLGFTEPELEKNPNHFSGGESAKISLAKALLNEPRILILDEPTNHLDIYSIEFLEDFVKNYRGTVIAVTHDRHFLQNCVEKILDMENFRATLYPGNYEKFVQLKSERRAAEIKAYEKQQEEIAKLEDFVRRNKVRASTAKRARSRQIALDRMERLEKPPSIEKSSIRLGDAAESANRVLILEKIFFKTVIKDFSAEIFKGEKIGLIGRNGVGKSTLLKIIVGELKADSGEIKIGNRVKIGYLSQGHEELNENLTPLEELNYEFGLTEGQARSELARLNLFAQVVEKPIADLSGGEKTRVALTKLILTGANFLILDEPTNHLDLPAREAIESALNDFDGTILIVTHDRYLLDKVATRIIEFAEATEKKISPPKPKVAVEKKSSAPKPNEQAIDKVEAQIKMAEMELKMIEHEINAASDPEKLTELAAAHAAKIAEIDEFYSRWEELQG